MAVNAIFSVFRKNENTEGLNEPPLVCPGFNCSKVAEKTSVVDEISEWQRVHIFSGPSRIRVLHVSSRVRVRVLLELDSARVRVQQGLSPCPSVCGSSPYPSPKLRKFTSSSTMRHRFHKTTNNSKTLACCDSSLIIRSK